MQHALTILEFLSLFRSHTLSFVSSPLPLQQVPSVPFTSSTLSIVTSNLRTSSSPTLLPPSLVVVRAVGGAGRGIVPSETPPSNLVSPNALAQLIHYPPSHPLSTLPPSHPLSFLLADFGFARYLTGTDMAATLCGSPLYMVLCSVMYIHCRIYIYTVRVQCTCMHELCTFVYLVLCCHLLCTSVCKHVPTLVM